MQHPPVFLIGAHMEELLFGSIRMKIPDAQFRVSTDSMVLADFCRIKHGSRVLDLGCGSGILSIVALKLGAKHAIGTDLDICTINAVAENKEANGIPEEDMELIIGNLIDDKEVQDTVGYEKYDIVLANILADVLEALTPEVIHQMKPGSLYITSGIIDDKEECVKEAILKAGLEIVEINYQNEWVAITARKPE